GVLCRGLVAGLVRAGHGRRWRGGEGDEDVTFPQTGEVPRGRQRQTVVREGRGPGLEVDTGRVERGGDDGERKDGHQQHETFAALQQGHDVASAEVTVRWG